MKLGPYDLNAIYTGDARVLAKAIPDGSIDLIVTSPPYDNLRQYNGYEFDFEGIAGQLARVLKPGGVIVWIVGDETEDGGETGTSFRQALYFMSQGLRLHDTMIYEKNGCTYPDSVRYYQVFEYMFIFSKGQPKTINLIADRKNQWGAPWGRKTSRGKDNDLKASKTYYKGNQYGVRFNIWRFNGGKGFSTEDETAYSHPAIFPEKLARDHIESWSNPGDIVLDPMCGSGTTCKMAFQTGRHYLGFDISDEYVNLARKRLLHTQPPLPLFSQEPQP